MTITIALAGKGGVGKTTLAALVIKYLVVNKPTPILAVDADPSSNLNMALGVDLDWTVGDIREELLSQVKTSVISGGAAMGTLPGGTSKRDYLDYHIRSSLVEGDNFDLIAMGKSEGKGCYCAVNHNLREVIDSISKNYKYIVIDNEAGMEHLSRRTTRDVQHLIIVSDPSLRGLKAAERIAGFRKELDINIEHAYLVLNRHAGIISDVLQKAITQIGIPLLGVIPPDDNIGDFDLVGKPIFQVDSSAASYQQVKEMMGSIL